MCCKGKITLNKKQTNKINKKNASHTGKETSVGFKQCYHIKRK